MANKENHQVSGMRKAVLFVSAIFAAAAAFNWADPEVKVRTDRELFGRNMIYADLCEYEDPDYGFTIRYPSFFYGQKPQEDPTGRARFSYSAPWATVLLEGYVMNGHGQTVKAAADSLAQALNATEVKLGADCFTLSGPQYENGGYIEGYSYHSKFVCSDRLWFVYTMVYPDRYRDLLGRMFREIDNWQVWPTARPTLRQGESQTPKGISE